MERDWKKYVELTKTKPPRPLLVEALSFVRERNTALDLGAGALNDSIYLLSEKFAHVIAVDKEPVAAEIAKDLPSERFTYKISSLEDFSFSPEVADLVNAQFALPFIQAESFNEVWEKIGNYLKIGGIFTGQLFGDRDEWNGNKDMTFHNKDQALQLLSSFETIDIKEKEKDKPTVAGIMKHWHIFHFIARK